MSFLLIILVGIGFMLGQHGGGLQAIAKRLAPLGQTTSGNNHVVAMQPTPYTPLPIPANTKPELPIQAQAGLIADPVTGKLLISKNPDVQLSPASLTKLMTALVLLDRHQGDETVTVTTPFSSTDPEAQKIGIRVGQKFRLDDMMQMMLVYSANDVAEALATYDAGSQEAFVTRMNDYAHQLGLRNTHFENPTGLDATDHYSSAADLLTLTRALLHNPRFRQIVAMPRDSVSSEGGTTFSFASTNKLLAYPYIIGAKTGKTAVAGECLITLSTKGGHELITVVLNSPDRFQESKNMVDYAFANYIWK